MKSLKGKNVVSLDITQSAIRVVYGKRLKDEIKVNKAFIINLPKGCYEDGVIVNYDSLLIALKDGLKINNIRNNKYGICTFDIKDVISRVMVLPVVKPVQLINMINLEMQQHIPIDLSNFIVQYKIQDTFTKENVQYHEILVVAAPRDTISDMQRLMKDAGMKSILVDWKPNSAYKLFMTREINGSIKIKEKSVILVNIYKEYTSFSIISKGKNKYNRVLPIGNRELYQALNKETVHELIDIDQIDSTEFIDSLDVHLDETSIEVWIDELERILKFYSSRESGNKVDSVLIYGNVKGLERLPKAIEEYLFVPAAFIESVNKIQLNKSISRFSESQYINVLGAMLSNYRVDKLLDFNFLEPYVRKEKRFEVSSILALILITLALSYVGLDFYSSYQDVKELEDRLDKVNTQMKNQAVQEKLDALELKHEEFEALASFNENLALIEMEAFGDTVLSKVYYYTFIGTIPETITVDTMDFYDGIIELGGEAINDLSVAEFQKRLRDTGLFEDIYVPAIALVMDEENNGNDISPDGRVAFDISLELRGVNSDEND
jgi:type IV pilus assembly protein PilM